MGKATAAGNVTAEEFTQPAVVRDALGRDHIVGPMRNREQLEDELAEVEKPAEDEKPKAEVKSEHGPEQTGLPTGSAVQKPAGRTTAAAPKNDGK